MECQIPLGYARKRRPTRPTRPSRRAEGARYLLEFQQPSRDIPTVCGIAVSKLPEHGPGLCELMTFVETQVVAVESDRADAVLAAGGDAGAFERLYRRHVARIHSLTRRMLGGEHAEEVTQDVFVRAWQKIGLFRGESAFGTWLHRLAINVVLARRGELGKARDRFSDDETVLDRVAARPATVDTRMDFEAALERLPAGAREIFVLHDIEGYKHEEIAELLQVTSGTSKSQLHRARMVLRQYLV